MRGSSASRKDYLIAWARWNEATIKAYIENQRWDEDDESFKITASTKPQAGSHQVTQIG